MRRLHRLWKQFRAWPEILQLMLVIAMAIFALLALPRSARAEQGPEPEVFVVCKAGKPVALRIVVPGKGTLTMGLPILSRNPCAGPGSPSEAPLDGTPPPADLPDRPRPQKTAVA